MFRGVEIRTIIQQVAVAKNHLQEIVEVMRHAAGKLANSLPLSGLEDLLCRLLGSYAFCDVTDVALNDFLVLYAIAVADEFNIDGSAVFRLQKQILIANVVLLLEFPESLFGRFNVLEQTNIPERLPHKFFPGVMQQF